jgi:oligosaccharide repeat unit polymerase
MDIYLFLVFVFSLIIIIITGLKSFEIDEIAILYVSVWVLSSAVVSIFQGYYISTVASLSHIAIVLFFLLPKLLLSPKFIYRVNKHITINNNTKILLLFNVIGMVGLLFHVAQFGFSLNIIELSKMASESRYNGDGVSIIQILSSSFLFVNCFIYGISNFEIDKSKIHRFSTLFLIVFSAVLTSSKATLLFSLTFYLAGISVYFILTGQKISLRSKIMFGKYTVVMLLIVVCLTMSLQVLRYGGDLSSLNYAFEKITIYTFGQFSAYSIWFDKADLFEISNLPGYGLFTGIYTKIFGTARVSGFYDTFTYISHDAYTNVFTLSRFLIADFTLLGTFMFMFFIGGVYRASLFINKFNHLKIPLYTAVVVEMIFGFSTSILSYNNVLLSLFIIYFFAKCNIVLSEVVCSENCKNEA